MFSCLARQPPQPTIVLLTGMGNTESLASTLSKHIPASIVLNKSSALDSLVEASTRIAASNHPVIVQVEPEQVGNIYPLLLGRFNGAVLKTLVTVAPKDLPSLPKDQQQTAAQHLSLMWGPAQKNTPHAIWLPPSVVSKLLPTLSVHLEPHQTLPLLGEGNPNKGMHLAPLQPLDFVVDVSKFNKWASRVPNVLAHVKPVVPVGDSLRASNFATTGAISNCATAEGTAFGPVPIQSIQFFSGAWMDGVVVNGVRYGGAGGTGGNAFTLADGEYFNAVTMKCTPNDPTAGLWFSNVLLTTNQGRTVLGNGYLVDAASTVTKNKIRISSISGTYKTDSAGAGPFLKSVTFNYVDENPTMEPDTDRDGTYISDFWQTTTEPSECQTKCNQTANCTTWVHVKPQPGGQARCYLKSGASNSFANTCCVSGKNTMEQNSDRDGAYISDFWQTTPDPSECQTKCNQTTNCSSWVHVKPGIQGTQARCYLKSGASNSIANTCCVSGKVTCPALTIGSGNIVSTACPAGVPGETCQLACATGTFGTPSVTCQAGGTWSTAAQSACKPVWNCNKVSTQCKDDEIMVGNGWCLPKKYLNNSYCPAGTVFNGGKDYQYSCTQACQCIPSGQAPQFPVDSTDQKLSYCSKQTVMTYGGAGYGNQLLCV